MFERYTIRAMQIVTAVLLIASYLTSILKFSAVL